MKKSLILLSLAFFVLLGSVQQASADIKIGVLAKRGAPKCMQQWGATAAYLSDELGEKVVIIPLKFEAIEPSVAAGRIDYMLANSAFYVEMEKKHGVQAVATLINSRNRHALDRFGGVILTRADSDIQELGDLVGKSFMVVKRSSFGGSQMAWRLMKDNGIDPDTDCKEVMIGNKHDNVVLAVQNGTCDAGTVRSDTLERMADEGKINMADFRIVNKVDDDFPFVHSTRLYPEWPLAACAATAADQSARVVAALKKLTPEHAAAKSAKIVGWADPADYAPVRECLTAIQYGAFATVQ